MNLIKKIQENIFYYRLFPRGAKIIIGVSGGPDSVCLLDVLYKLKNKYKLNIIIAHVNYGLRGKDSENDEKLVRNLAKKYSLPFEIIHNTQYKKHHTNLEEKLRNIRYAFFEKIRKKYKANVIAVGHNLNDQAETALMRILRGTGLRGMSAIKFKNQRIIRPLLNIPRKEITAYLGKNKIPYRTDKTNLSSDFTRNKIRNKLLPYIEKNFNPNIHKVLYKLSETAGADFDFINRFAKEWLVANKKLRISALNNLHPSIQREVIRLAIEKVSPGLKDIESAHMDEILKVIRSSKNKRQKIILKDLKIERIGDNLTIIKV